MLKKRKTEPTPPIHDRRSTDLLANAMAIPVVVDDPLEPGAKLVVMRSIRDDILAAMLSRGEIDQAKFDAGREYQKNAEVAEIGNVQAIDPSKEAVDGGGWCDVLSNAQANAVRALGEARRVLTPVNDDLIRSVLVGRASFTKLGGSERAATRLKERFFMGLEILAALWGKTNRRVRELPIPPTGS